LDRGREGGGLHDYIPNIKEQRAQGEFVGEFGVGRKRERSGNTQETECVALSSAKTCY
jgi:hypothetical protein